MNKEIEVKFKIDNKKQIEKNLLKFNWVKTKEINSTTFGFFSKDSIKKGIFPRLRIDNELITFTVKIKKEKDKNYFTRNEYTITISNPQEVEIIIDFLKIFGYDKIRIFEKYRKVWFNNKTKLQICIDKLPFGDYIEIEGSRNDIEKMIRILQLKGGRIIKSYLGVYEDWCKIRKIKPKSNIIF